MIIAWQGWQIEVPDRWGPVKLEGDAQEGYLLMADLHRPRMGIRWKSVAGKRFKAEPAVNKAMIAEVGVLATAESRKTAPKGGDWLAPLLYEDPKPPGRDVWVGYSQVSRRLFQIVYHAHHRERILTERVLPTLEDSKPGEAMAWSIFDLSCRTPAGMALVKQRLNAGDLALMFEGSQKRAVNVRQLAVAKLALQRRPIEKWIAEQASWRGKCFKLHGSVDEVDASPKLVRQQTVRRWRYAWMWWMAAGFVVLAKHDLERDRLIIVDATDEGLAREVMQSASWAVKEK